MTAAQEEEEMLMKEKQKNTLARETKIFLNPELPRYKFILKKIIIR